ncbi:MAG: sigma factor-like helix-turn-helix DNA-binding protein, partial [Candidatus Thorarchaeota archaeon]
HDLYFKHNLSQKAIAEHLGIAESTVGRAFKKNGWIARDGWRTRHPKSVDPIKIWRMYFEEGLTQREIAERLGIGRSRIIGTLKTHGWKARPAKPRSEEIDPEEVWRLYFVNGFTQKEVAEKLGLRSTSPIQRIFKEKKWKVRGRWGPDSFGGRRHFETDAERELARKERYQQRLQRIRQMRDALFGTECVICRKSKDEKPLHIHRKDCDEHEQNYLWKEGNLRSLDSNEYAALCVACHRGVHWLERKRGTEWKDIEKLLRDSPACAKPSKELIPLPDKRTPSSKEYERVARHIVGGVEELRDVLFGVECHFCGTDYEDRRLVIHRKDGRPHNLRLLEKERYLRTLKLDEWVALCQKCHRYVHWAEEKLGLSWSDLKKKRS